MASRWYYLFPGNFHAFGPTQQTFPSERLLRAHLRRIWNLDRLPRRTECWRA